MGLKKTETDEVKAQRRQRILGYVTSDEPLAFRNIMRMEGVSDSFLRHLIKELEAEHGFKYFGTAASRVGDQPPVGLTEATFRFRSRLANELYKVADQPEKYGLKGRTELAGRIGMNSRTQNRALNNPYDHDWTLSQIERLARLMGEEPWAFHQKCLST